MKKRVKLYTLLTILLSLVILNQIIVNNLLEGQKADGTIINYAGRQRMLSQNIAKNVVTIQNKAVDNLAAYEEKRNLRKLLQDFTTAHNGLKERDEALDFGGENSLIVKKMFDEIQPSYDIIIENTRRLLKSNKVEDIKAFSSTVMNNEQSFLGGMNSIVFQYNKEYNHEIKNITTILLTLLLIMLGFFIFGGIYIGRLFGEKQPE